MKPADQTVFGKAAVEAAKQAAKGESRLVLACWTAALKDATESMRNKPCPKHAFLGLCDKNLVKGVSPDASTKTTDDSGRYAVTARTILQSRPDLAHDPIALWTEVLKQTPGKDSYETYNQQMHVVIALWDNNLLL